jgi:2-amino-4-hydroxy-6-hydroxymethyldihydropteridine diphosphokinase
VGDPVERVWRALRDLARLGPVRASSLYRTEPLGPPGQPWYVNAVAELLTAAGPISLHERLRALERRAGRPVQRSRWSPRVLDLDLLLYDDRVLVTDDLEIPHRGLASRRFVLEPLAELEPEARDPRSGRTARDLLLALDDPLRVEKLSPP